MKSMQSQNILTATSVLKEMKNVNIIDNWRWYPSISKWVIKCQLHIISANPDLVPNETNWYIMIDDVYPNGDVDFNPAKDDSITATFPHQFYNKIGEEDIPWRKGRICAKTELFYLRKRAYDIEPFEVDTRLLWHIERVIDWLHDASRETLTNEGDPFELPDYDTNKKPYTVAFCESQKSYQIWHELIGRYGIVRLSPLKNTPSTYLTLSFEDKVGNVHYAKEWNDYVMNQVMQEEIGAWVLLPDVLAIAPWQAPMTWEELGSCIDRQSLPWRKLIGRISGPLRDGRRHFVLIGFPIPNKIGGELRQIHWQPLYLPILSWTKDVKGYQAKRIGFLRRDRDVVLQKNRSLDWQRSENWDTNEIFNRGMFEATLTEAKIVVIGAGALGSMVSEMFVRGGAKNLTIIDNDKIEIGNLTRHTLSLVDLETFKAESLATHLLTLSPHVRTKSISAKLENLNDSNLDYIRDHDIVIDTTGNDDVLFYIEKFNWSRSPFFCSISIGLNANRLYLLTARKRKFPLAFFKRHVEKWLEKDLRENDGLVLPRSGGIGCWHPAFPGKVDDMWVHASIALKYIENHLRANQKGATLCIFEKIIDNNSFKGIRLVSEHHDNG